MEEELFRVVLKGYGPGKGYYYIEKDFAELFKLPVEKVKDLFKATPRVLKKNLTSAQAEKYLAAIKGTGADCEIESNRFDLSGLSLE